MLKVNKTFNEILNYYTTNKNRLHRLSKEGIWIIIGQVLSILGGFALLKVLTNNLDPTEYGKFSLSLTIAGLISLVFFGGINNGIGRYFSIAEDNEDVLDYVHASTKMLKFVSFIVLFVGFISILVLFFSKNYNWIWLIIFSIVFAIFSSYSSAISGFQNAARKRSIVAFHGFLDSWLKVGLSIIFFLFFGRISIIVMLVFATSSILVTLSQLFFLHQIKKKYKNKKNQINHQWGKKIWSFSWPFYATNLFGWAQQSAGRWFLEEYSTKKDVGLYSVISQLGYTPIQTATSFLLTFLTPILFARMGDGTSLVQKENVRSLTNKLSLFALLLILFAFITTTFFHQQIFQVLVNHKYYTVSIYLPWMILSGGTFAIAQIYAVRLQALFMMDKLVVSGILISIIGVLFSFFGIKYYGIPGAVIGSLLFSLTYFFLMLYWFYKKS
jgi:O-antigen/teichoic acid export membrane protein